MYAQIDVTGPALDLHSGTYGGNVQNPAIALARIIASLKPEDGRVAVPGFYDEVRGRSPNGTATSSHGCRFDEATSSRGSGCRSCSASRTSCPSSAAAPGRRWT